MSLEDRIRSTVDQAVVPLVRQILEEAAADRAAALQAAHADGETKMREALDAAERRMRVTLAESETKAAEALQSAVSEARVKEREIEMAAVSRLLESVRGLDGATSLSEVLDALALASAREAARVAVVVVRGDRVQGWRLSGFGARDAQPKAIDLALADSGVIGHATGVARAVTTRDTQGTSGPGFDTIPADSTGLAVPVIVAGRVVAVVYADTVAGEGQDRQVPSSWPELIEILARHAGRCLEALASQRAATPRAQTPATGGATSNAPSNPSSSQGPSAMMRITDGVQAAALRTARLLVAEIRLFHESAVTEGRRHRNLLSRLAPEIEKARQAYNEQVPAGVRSHTDYFHQELIRTLAGGDATLLGNLV